MQCDFRLSTGLFFHPKFLKLQRRLGADGALSYLQLLSFVAQNNLNGLLTDMSGEDIVLASGYRGDGAEFMQAMKEIKLIDSGAGAGWSYQITDWGFFARVVPLPTDQQLFDSLRAKARQEFSAIVFARDLFKCTYCGSKTKITLDHIVPLSRGGDNSLENLTTACQSCNSKKNNKTPEEWLK